jgi:hypothetical protein
MSEEKTVLLSIKLDTGDLKKNSEEASKKLEELKTKQAILRGENKQGTAEYAKLSAEIKAQNAILNQSSKAIEINERLGNKQNLTLKEQADILSAGKVALRNLTADQIANTESGRQLNKEVNDLNESLKNSEKAYGDNQREVGNYDKGIRGLKAELKDLKSQMVGLDAGSKEYQQASEKAGVLGDKIKEVNENVKASSGGTGFEKLSNNLGLVKDDLMNLDFAGVSEKMKQMAVISKGMTFKEVIGGLKNMGSSLLSLGKAILANPLFLMVGAIVAIVGALKMWSDYSAEQAVKAQDKHTKALERNIETIKTQQKTLERSQELELKRAELEGKSAEELGKIKLRHLSETNKKQIEEQKAFNKLSSDLTEQIAIAERQGNEDRKNDLEDKKEDAEKSFIDLYNENLLYEDKRTNLIIETNNAIRDENKTNNEKILADNKKAEEDRLALAYKIKDLILDNEDLKNENQSKIIEAHYKYLEDTAEGNVEELLKIQEEKNNKLTQLDLDIYNDTIARQEENYKREQDDAKGNAKLLAQLKINNQTEIDKINIDFDNKQKDRENQQLKDTENLNKAKVESERKAKQEIGLINAELNYLKSKGTDNEKQAFLDYQNEKIKVLQENAKLEIELNKLVGVEADAVNSKLALETKKIQNEELKEKEKTDEKDVEKTLTKEQLKAQKTAEITLQSATQLTDALSQITQNRIANELLAEQNKNDENQKQLQSQLDANLITQAEYDVKKSAMDVEFKATESKLKKEAFEKEKQANIIKAIMNTAVSVTASLPNVPLSILAGVLGAVQVGLIASQPTPKFAKGGLFGGNSHANGGTKGVFSDGTQIEVEKDESFFILNKRATPLISQLSNINMATGGVPLMANGGAIKFQNGGAVASSLSNNLDNQLNAQNQLLRMIELMPKPVVIVQDINDAQGNLATVENRANF